MDSVFRLVSWLSLYRSANINNIQRLCKFRGFTETTTERVLMFLGLQPRHISPTTNEDLYDLIQTYEFCHHLTRLGGDWQLAWDAVSAELDDEEIIARLHLTYEQLRKDLEGKNLVYLVPKNIASNRSGSKLYLLFEDE